MKKFISILCVLMMLVICLTACGDDNFKEPSNLDTPNATNPSDSLDTPEATVYNILNALVDKEYSKVTLSVKTTTDSDTLQGSYTVESKSDAFLVTYSYEKLNEFTEVGGVISPPADAKSTVNGRMKIKDGKIIEQDGEGANIAIEQLNVSGLSFKESYFVNVKTENGSFSADVTSANDLLGFNIPCENMKINVSYSTDTLKSLNIQYTSDGNSEVVISYTFTT